MRNVGHRADGGRSAVTADRLEPLAGLAVVGPGAVVLSAADHVVARILGVDREALELQRVESDIQAGDLGRNGCQPHLAIGSGRRHVMPRFAQSAEALTKSPLVRTTPPSEPMMAMSGASGINTIAC